MIVSQVAGGVTDMAGDLARRCPIWSSADVKARCVPSAGSGEPVVRVRPGCGLLRIVTRRTDPLSEFG